MENVSFLRMDEGTPEDYVFLHRKEVEFTKELPSRILVALNNLENSHSGYKISRLEHSLQSATRAEADGADIEMIVAALIHDIGDILTPHNHPDLAAAILKPFVSDANHWMVQHHGIFQGYFFWHHLGGDRNARDEFAGNEFYDHCEEFCALYDAPAFDTSYTSNPLEYYVPLIHDFFGRNP